ncbi:MAG: glycosyltransferase family 4 protein [Anaerolineae bacterium]|nr:glycosyltransferase family 4 protein [Anaerolineae bacterium]
MLVGIDASRASAARRTGTENYSLYLIRNLLALGGEHRFRLYFREAPEPSLLPGAAEERVIPFPRLWTHVALSWEMFRHPPDLLFVPSHVLPLVQPPCSVATVHDLGYHYFPQAHTLSQNLYLRWSTRHNARSATRVLADSEATRRDLIRLYGIPEARIAVVYPGRDESLVPVHDPLLLDAVQARYGLRAPYILYLGTLHPRKNLVRLVQAFAHLQSRASETAYPLARLQLVLAGQKGWLYEEVFAEVKRLGLEGRVVLTGYVAGEDLPALLSGAEAFAFPSLYEGFGFPVLEAMACGVPVVCSGTSSLPEVAGDAALLVDPLDVEAIGSALFRLLTDDKLSRELVARGLEQVQRFSWRRCAQQTLANFEQAARVAASRRPRAVD